MRLKQIATAVLALAGMSSAMAVTISGTHFDISYSGTGLFDAPTIVGDTIVWNPSAFTAKTFSDVALVDSTAVLTITAKNGWTLTSFGLAEAGDYAYYGTGNVVAAGGELRVTSLVTTPTTVIDDITMAGPTTAQATIIPFPTQKWTADASVSLTTTSAAATIQNLLFAVATDQTAADYAFIQKKYAALTVGVSAVPEPETYAMMLAGLGAIGFLASRRRG